MKLGNTASSENEINIAYEQAVAEIGTGFRRPGIGARARVESEEKGTDVESTYLRLLAEQILEENNLTKRKVRREAVVANSVAAVGGAANWLKYWLGFSAAAIIILGLLGLIIGFQLLEVMTPASANWSADAKIGGAARIGVWLFGASAFILICLFMFPFFRKNWITAAVIALIPVPFIYKDLLDGVKASAEIESRRNRAASTEDGGSSESVPAARDSQSYSENVHAQDYDSLLKEYEARYPQMNPDSSNYDEALTLRIGARMQAMMSQGTEAKEALVRSVALEISTSQRPQGRQEPYQRDRFVSNGSRTVLDTERNFVWADSDSGRAIGWEDAKQYCAGKGPGWSLPSVAQLQGLYDGKYSQSCRGFICNVTPLVRLSNYWFWTKENNGSSEAWVVFMTDGNKRSVEISFGVAKGLYALCVRSP